jgi:hypothetical protein
MDRSNVSPPGRAVRLIGFTFLLLAVLATSVYAQFQTGNVYGTVTDSSGAALPGVTVTLSGVGAPQTFTTGDDGRFRFLSLSPGRYSIRAELSGLGNAARDNVQVNVGANTTVDMSLAPTVEQTITVTAETPLLDPRRTGTGATITKIELEQVPSARDPWVMLQQAPGVLMDRVNVGGNESGQQSNYVAKGTSGAQATWNIDGVNITDMAATGSSPTYYDFDAFEEMQITTGGSDPRIQTAGANLNMVTKRGTNELNGSARYFITDGAWQADPEIPSEATSYLSFVNEIDENEDVGIEIGGPIIRDRLWMWGSYGEQNINLLTASGGQSQNPDSTTLENINAKINAQILSNNSATFLYTNGDKQKYGRQATSGTLVELGSAWIQSGPTDLYKLEDTHIFGPNFFLTGLISKVESGFALAPIGGMDQEAYSDEFGDFHNTFLDYSTDRPQDNYRLDASTFFDTGSLNHELRFGFGYRDAPVTSLSVWPGDRLVYYYGEETCTEYDLGPNCGQANLFRPGVADYGTEYTDLYVGDTMMLGNLTLQAGLRMDIQKGQNNPSTTTANAIVPDFLPAYTYGGDEEGVEWTSISPRLGATYTFGSTRRTLVRGAYNRYADQIGAGVISGGNPIGIYQYLAFYFNDFNNDKHIQRNELDFDTGPLFGYNVDPEDPAAFTIPGRYDDDMDAPTTDEFILGVEHELLPEFTIGVNYTHRIFDDFIVNRYEKTQGAGDFYSAADYELGGTLTGELPNGESYSVPYYQLKAGVDPAQFYVVTNDPGYSQTYDGLELNATKRMSNRWMMRANISLNDWKQKVDESGFGFGDPTPYRTTTGCNSCDGEQVVQGSGTGSGAKGGIYINSRWSYNITGVYELPWQINLGASLNGREGYAAPYVHEIELVDGRNRDVLVDGVDGQRFDDIMNLDLRLAKEFRFAGTGLTLSADAFNVTDERTILQRGALRLNETRGEATNPVASANRISEIQSPRVFRLGARFSF